MGSCSLSLVTYNWTHEQTCIPMYPICSNDHASNARLSKTTWLNICCSGISEIWCSLFVTSKLSESCCDPHLQQLLLKWVRRLKLEYVLQLQREWKKPSAWDLTNILWTWIRNTGYTGTTLGTNFFFLGGFVPHFSTHPSHLPKKFTSKTSDGVGGDDICGGRFHNLNATCKGAGDPWVCRNRRKKSQCWTKNG